MNWIKNVFSDFSQSRAFRFVLMLGIVDLFGDMTYSGGASMNGLFLGSLGASAAAISIAGGASEFLNYLTRGISGYVGDRIEKHWVLVFAGYIVNLLAVPALALVGYWQLAAGLIILQGIGRGTRKPITQTMLSHAVGEHGRGSIYGIHSAMDHGGRALGPLVIALVLFLNGSFQTGYTLLLIPALLSLSVLTFTRVKYPVPAKLEQQEAATEKGFTTAYWLYLVSGAFFAAGLMNFELISYHLAESGISREVVPLFLVLATTVGAFGSFGLGKLYDRVGLPVILGAVFVTTMFSPFVFLLPISFAFVGLILWGIGQTTQDTLLSSVVAGVLPEGQRNLAFGLFYAGYGFSWLLGAAAAGFLYEQSPVVLVIFAASVQIVSIPLFIVAHRRSQTS